MRSQISKATTYDDKVTSSIQAIFDQHRTGTHAHKLQRQYLGAANALALLGVAVLEGLAELVLGNVQRAGLLATCRVTLR